MTTMSDLGGGLFPPAGTGNQHAAGMADAGHAAHAHRRLQSAESKAALKATRPGRFAGLRRLLNRLTRRTG
jgi:hypothetical protein